MKTKHWLTVVFCLGTAVCAMAQPSLPRIGYAYPAGGRQGESFRVVLGGQFLDGATNAFVTHGDLKLAVVDRFKPLTQKQFNDLRESMQQLQQKRAASVKNRGKRQAAGTPAGTNAVWTAEDEKKLADIRKQLASFQRRPMNPAIAETVTLRVTIPADAEPGRRELRVMTPMGLSNPLAFEVGDLPEFSEKEIKPEEPPPLARKAREAGESRTGGPEVDTPITLPAVVNGQIMPGDVDRFRFRAVKGQHLVFSVRARDLIPYLADAVPGWFQAALTLYDAKGKEVAYDDDFRFHPDPLLHVQVPADGEYVLEIKDAIYRGREDFVYRVAVGELPFITSVFPPGHRAGEDATVELKGWNLPVKSLAVKEPREGESGIQVKKGNLVSNRVPLAVDDTPENTEQEPNETAESAQKASLPVLINGRIGASGDQDVFHIEGRAGQKLVAEVRARRLGSPLDSVLRLTDSSGKQIAFNDDYEDKGAGLNTHHADSYLSTTLPTDGVYHIFLADTQRKGGPEYTYRLRLGPPQPDFALRVVPSSITVRGGGTMPLTVYALRKDGLTNAIRLALDDAPAGFQLEGAEVPPGQDRVRLTLTVPPRITEEPITLKMEGRAIVEGRPIVRPVVPADDMMQAFFYRHLVPAQELQVAVVGRFMQRFPPRIVGDSPVKIPAGGSASVRVSAVGAGAGDRFQFELSEPPDGIAIDKINTTRDGAEIVLRSEAGKAKPGLRGNLIVSVYPGRTPALEAQKKKAGAANPRRFALGTLPAIPFEVIER